MPLDLVATSCLVGSPRILLRTESRQRPCLLLKQVTLAASKTSTLTGEASFYQEGYLPGSSIDISANSLEIPPPQFTIPTPEVEPPVVVARDFSGIMNETISMVCTFVFDEQSLLKLYLCSLVTTRSAKSNWSAWAPLSPHEFCAALDHFPVAPIESLDESSRTADLSERFFRIEFPTNSSLMRPWILLPAIWTPCWQLL